MSDLDANSLANAARVRIARDCAPIFRVYQFSRSGAWRRINALGAFLRGLTFSLPPTQRPQLSRHIACRIAGRRTQ